ncbi:bifunctional copper resistance protein CopD/cytochrome c oxidase assembly protein [Agromyces albus]|uniref:bifunctional copper resistance protein CopD/cytochrome c oxidase assembly protein n=1 Tax=Agromyces albus TaxID=205332 RepID=UPI0027858AD1|nr:bifunctional copper resistance protein CopD/cytochrome c oxidase assembly protein [Agromyces albus]MDQ0577297.1 cytochrome c oxidase assembly factor CtaG/putative copper export protein [Agromyces albus]
MPRSVRVLGPAVLLAVALLATFAGLAYGGGAEPYLIQDPGPIARFGVPVAKLLVNLGAAGMLGALVLAVWALTPERREFDLALDVAAASAALLTVASAATGFFTFLVVTAVPFDLSESFGQKVGQFATTIPLGQAWLTTTLIAAAVTVLCFAVRNQTALVFVTVVAVAALVPLAQQGHAAGAAGHSEAITALGLHLVFAGVWVGGLVTIVLLRRELGIDRLPVVLTRYSTVALICFIVVALSGYASAALRIGTWDELGTPYGSLVLVKVTALIALGLFGAAQRRFLIGRIVGAGEGRQPAFWVLVVAELAFMGLASGVAAALARTPTPVPEQTGSLARTPAEILTGEPLPPWPVWYRFFTEWSPDLIWLLASGFGIFFYLVAVRRLRKRGDHWPVYRTVLWVAGLLLLAYITSGGVNVYEQYLFSAHMGAHMVLTMAVPVLLVPGAPITLAARAIRPRKDGSRGGREWIMLAVHSRFAGVIANPIVAALLFAGSLWVFYYSPLFRWTMLDHIGHEWMIVHFLITGYLFVQSLIGIDPVPYRLPHAFRLVLLLGTMAFHAFFGLAIMSGTGLLLADWYGAMGWGTDALVDQQLGGGIAWSIGEIPTVALAITVAMQWARSDEKESRRRDRHADRTGDAELEAYNARLAAIAEHDESRS